jgi:hypothetical protein
MRHPYFLSIILSSLIDGLILAPEDFSFSDIRKEIFIVNKYTLA